MGCSSSAAALDAHAARASQQRSWQPTALFDAEYKVDEEIGKGSFGHVYLARRRSSFGNIDQEQPRLAVKIVEVKHSVDADDKEQDASIKIAQEEANLWKRLCGHQNIVCLCRTFVSRGYEIQPSKLYFLMELCRGPLLDCADLTTEAHVAGTSRQMLEAIAHVHACAIVHRDIKVSNFLVGYDSHIKLCDFGLSRALPPLRRLAGVVGTPPYMAPEVVTSSEQDYAVDIWSFGVTLYKLLFGQYPYPHRGRAKTGIEYKQAIARGLPVLYEPSAAHGIQSVSPRAFRCLRSLLLRQAVGRPSAEDALCCDFLKYSDGAFATLVQPKPCADRKPSRSGRSVGRSRRSTSTTNPASAAEIGLDVDLDFLECLEREGRSKPSKDLSETALKRLVESGSTRSPTATPWESEILSPKDVGAGAWPSAESLTLGAPRPESGSDEGEQVCMTL